MRTLRAHLAAAALLCISTLAQAACIDRVDVSKASGIDTAKLAAVICDASVMGRIMDSATVRDSYFAPSGGDLFAKYLPDIETGRMTEKGRPRPIREAGRH